MKAYPGRWIAGSEGQQGAQRTAIEQAASTPNPDVL